MRPSRCGRADLVRALQADAAAAPGVGLEELLARLTGAQHSDTDAPRPQLLAAVAEMLDYAPLPVLSAPKPASSPAVVPSAAAASQVAGAEEVAERAPLADVPFWRLERWQEVEAVGELVPVVRSHTAYPAAPTAIAATTMGPADFPPLSPWHRLLPRLRRRNRRKCRDARL